MYRQCLTLTRQTLHVSLNIPGLSLNHRFLGKTISITYSECVSVAVFIQHARRMCRIILPSVAGLVLRYFFFRISQKRHDFREKLWNIKRVFWFSLQLLSEMFLTLRRTGRYIARKVHMSSYKASVIFVRFSWKFNFLDKLSKNNQISNFMKIRP